MLTLWNPFVPVQERSDSRLSVKNYFDRLFEDSFSNMTSDLFNNSWSLAGIQHLKNEDGSLGISVDIPGIKEEDINIELKDNMIYVKGERKTPTSSYSVNKSFTIPQEYTTDNIKAELVNGVLSLTLLPKPTQEKEVKKIAITSHK